MNTGAKVAIGCGVAVLVVGGVIVAGVIGVGFWAKGKAEQLTGNERKIEDLQKRADANRFSPPADGLLREDRLVTFLDVRKQIYGVYEQHKDELEAISKKKKGDLSDVTTGFGIVNDLRLAQAQALADKGMSQAEYRFMVEQIYKTMWAAEVAKQTGGKSVSQAAGEAYDTAADRMKQAAEAAGSSPAPDEATRKSLEEMKKGSQDLRKEAEDVRERAKDMDVPPENVALFRKYESDIKKYAMSGLEWIGL